MSVLCPFMSCMSKNVTRVMLTCVDGMWTWALMSQGFWPSLFQERAASKQCLFLFFHLGLEPLHGEEP